MNITFRDLPSGKQGSITLDGKLTVGRAEEMRMLLIKALIDSDDVRVGFGAVEDVDLSCLQLLCSAHRSAARMKKHFSLSGHRPELFTRTVKEAGFTRLVGCRLDADHSCLWVAR
jgi:anti-anti-sigma regulatory factor